MADLINGVKKMSQWIGIQERTEPVKVAAEQGTELRLKLVGAIFITPEKHDGSDNGLDRF